MFADRLRAAMQAAGYEAKPAVLEREFNTRFWGKPMTLHGVRRWLRGETLPTHEKLLVLAEWLAVPQRKLIREVILTFAKVHGTTPIEMPSVTPV